MKECCSHSNFTWTSSVTNITYKFNGERCYKKVRKQIYYDLIRMQVLHPFIDKKICDECMRSDIHCMLKLLKAIKCPTSNKSLWSTVKPGSRFYFIFFIYYFVSNHDLGQAALENYLALLSPF